MSAPLHPATGPWPAALGAPPGGPPWLAELRQRALQDFRRAGLPHRKVEAWKYAPVQVLDDFGPPAEPATVPADLAPAPLCDKAACIDIAAGRLARTLPELPAGATALPLAEAFERFEPCLRELFEAVPTDGPARAYVALNTALADQGLVIHVPAGQDAGRVLLRWFSAPSAGPVLAPFRLVLLLEEGARLDLVEQYQGDADSRVGLNLMLQADLAGRAELSHTRVQAESAQSVLLTTTTVQQGAESRYAYRGFDVGARLARHELTVRLQGAGAGADLAGAFVLDGQRYADHHLSVEHLAPGCRSEQFFRGVLGGRSRGVFNGRALIQAGADGASVRQSNANLLLSRLAEMDSKPELEIYADEVEASHGATVGQLDETAVFYLRSRGLDEAAARRMLTGAHCRAVTERVEGRQLADRIGELLDAAMPDSEL